jgi:hypothetical protein
MMASFGAGGDGAGTTAPGEPGKAGTTSVNQASSLLTGVETTLGPELAQ